MKKILFIVLFCAIFLVGCGTEAKVYNGGGVTITLESDFKEFETDKWDIYLENKDMAFMSKKIDKKTKIGGLELSHFKLAEYMKIILQTNKVTSESFKVEGMNGDFYYAFYTTLEDKVVKDVYMIMVMESKDYFYNINFSCSYDNYQNCKQDFLRYAVTIIVE